MREVETSAAARGQRVLIVETSGLPEFERTRDFYRRLGYTEVARIRDYYAAVRTRSSSGKPCDDDSDADRATDLVSDFDGFVSGGDTSWRRRRAHCAALLCDAAVVVLLARDDHGPAGYALARLIIGPDDTFDTRAWYDRVILGRVKTAISLPDKTFHRVEDAARRLGVSRSEFFARAAERWLEALDDESTTDAINRAIEGVSIDTTFTDVAASGLVANGPQ